MNPLEVIGAIQIPAGVMAHRFVREALGCARLMAQKVDDGMSREQVVGTANTRAVELYGWAPNVAAHADKTGFIYLVALNDGKSTVNVWNGGDAESVWLPAGAVVRLNDHHVHWTEDDRTRVCAFVGSYAEPCDAEALALLQTAVTALAAGDYYGAPRVQPGFRVLLPDECLVPNAAFDEATPMLLADARRQRRWYERCVHCKKPANRLDDHWPYNCDRNLCSDHMKAPQ